MNFSPVHIKGHLYFITGALVDWIPLFNQSVYRKIILEAWEWHIRNRHLDIFAFVIMPDHVHWISTPLEPYTINHNLWSFSSYTAHQIIKTSLDNDHQYFLNVFSNAARPGKKHKIWQDFQAKNIYKDQFLKQKIEYIHNNPINKFPTRYKYRSDYLYSSAAYYDLGQRPIITITDIYNFLDNLK